MLPNSTVDYCFGVLRTEKVLFSRFFVVAGDESEKGRVMGILRSLGALARATGPLVASTCYWLFGARFTYAVGGSLLVFPFLLLRTAQLETSSKTD